MQLHQHQILPCIAVIIFLMVFGCSGAPEPKSSPFPEWVNSTPQDDRYFYAVGISGQTRHVKDAWNQAIQRARAELGKTIITHVSSQDLVITTTKSEYSQQIVQALSDTELNFTEVLERWHDRDGIYGPPNHYYVLVRMEKKQAEKILKGIR
jgi:hypothetical protein